VYVPLDAATAARAAIVLGAAGPWGLVELGLSKLPDAARTGEEGEHYRAADLQELARLDFRHTAAAARLAARPAPRARCGKASITDCRIANVDTRLLDAERCGAD
jgi:hypothetical protein